MSVRSLLSRFSDEYIRLVKESTRTVSSMRCNLLAGGTRVGVGNCYSSFELSNITRERDPDSIVIRANCFAQFVVYEFSELNCKI